MLTPKLIEEILAKKPENRYKYFVKTVCAEEEVWGLVDDEGWLMLEDDDDSTEVIPVFPNREFAEIFREKGEFDDFKVDCLDLYEFVDWLDDFEAEKMKIAVFPTPEFQCAVIPPQRLKEDFQVEFDKEDEA
jgi:hypothetical protein